MRYSRSLLTGLTACAALLLGAVPARAGSYSVFPVSGSGSVTYTSGSNSTTTPLSSSFYSGDLGSGQLTYTYTENWHYSWEPSSDEDVNGSGDKDEPVDDVFEFGGSVQFDMWSTSSAMDSSGSANGTVTLGGNSASANLSVAQGGAVITESGNGVPHALAITKVLSGWSGDFTLTYSGSLSVEPSGAVVAGMVINPPMGGQSTNYWIYVTSPRKGSTFQGGLNVFNPFITVTPVEIEGVWKCPGGSSGAAWRIHVDGIPNPAFDIDPNIPVSPPSSPGWTNWSSTYPFYSGQTEGKTYGITAWLQYQNSYGDWVSDMEPPMWHSSTSFTVNY